MTVKSIFSAGVAFGSLVTVKTSLKLPPTTDGQWQVSGVTYNLETITPHGDWFMTLNLVPKGSVSVPPL